MTHLILHKVRGEPAFDVAENIGDEIIGDLWIIPTSGHRAYPYQTWPLEDIMLDMYCNGITDCDPMPPDHPDHYSINDAKPQPTEPKPKSPQPQFTADDL